MRARALRLRSDLVRGTWPGRSIPRRPSLTALTFLRGRDADGRLRELIHEHARARPRLAALAEAVVRTRAHEALGFRSLGDWSLERIGVGARAVSEWARVWRRLRSCRDCARRYTDVAAEEPDDGDRVRVRIECS